LKNEGAAKPLFLFYQEFSDSIKNIKIKSANTERICHQGNIFVWLGENIIDSKHEML